MLEFQYQNSTKWWCHQWLKLNLLKPRSFLGIIPKASQTKFHQIRITKSKVIHAPIPIPKWKKTRKRGKKLSRLQNEVIGESFMDYKLRQVKLQLEAALGISIRDKKITNRGRDFKSGKRDCKSGQKGFS